MSARLEAVGIPVMDDVTQWVAAAAALARWGKVKPKK
jgi:Asp/Glu/hydantoin racemase